MVVFDARLTLDDVAHRKAGTARIAEVAQDFVELFRCNDQHHSNTEIEGPPHIVLRHLSLFRQEAEDGWDLPRTHLDYGAQPVGQDPRQIIGQAAACDVGHGVHPAVLDQRPYGLEIAAVNRQQLIGYRTAEFFDRVARPEPQLLEKDLPGERVAICVETSRRQTDQHVTRFRRSTIDDSTTVDEPYDKTGEIVLAVTVKTRHLRGFTTE